MSEKTQKYIWQLKTLRKPALYDQNVENPHTEQED